MIFLDILLETCVVNRKISLLTCMREIASQPSLSKFASSTHFKTLSERELWQIFLTWNSLHTLFSHSCHWRPSISSPFIFQPICYILLHNSHPLLDLPMFRASHQLPFNSKPASVNLFCRRQEGPEPDWEIHRRSETLSQNLKNTMGQILSLSAKKRKVGWKLTKFIWVLIGKSTVNCQLYPQLKILQEVGKPFVRKSVHFTHWFTDTPWCHNPGKITHPPDVVVVTAHYRNTLFFAPRMQILAFFWKKYFTWPDK